MAQQVVAGVDDRDDRRLGVATRDDRAGLRLRVDVREHLAMELAEALASVGLAAIAEGFAKRERVAPDVEERGPDLA